MDTNLMALVTLTGGAFQDAEGHLLVDGFLTMTLSHDEQDPSSNTQIAAGIPVKILLDNNGNVSSGQSVWATDVLLPAGAYYIIEAFRSDGTLAWASPQFETVPSGGPFNIGTWIPNQPVPQPPPSKITLQTNGVNNGSQTLENLVAGANVTLTNVGGATTIASSGAGFIGVLRGLAITGSSNGSPLINQGIEESLAQTGTGTQSYVVPNATAVAGTQLINNTTTNCTGLGGYIRSFTMGTISQWRARVKCNQSTNTRFWIGFWDDNNNFNAHFNADSGITTTGSIGGAVGAVVAFRFSTAASDANWQAYVQLSTGGGSLVTNTGVAFDTTTDHLFSIVPNGSGSVKFFIDNSLVATVTDSHVPALSVPMTNIFSVDGVGVSSTNTMNFYYVWMNQSV
jgi:hypothetical protein